MIVIDDTIVSLDLIEQSFVCNLKSCKGECCVEGDAGAPIEKDEVNELLKCIDVVKEYMRPEGIESLEINGLYTIDDDGDLVTPLIEGKECAFVIYEDGISKCAIEKAFYEKETNFLKPISCHLYPVRLAKYNDYTAVNYHEWHICKSAVKLGKKQGVPVYQFLKEPLIRQFGEAWFEELEQAVRYIKQSK